MKNAVLSILFFAVFWNMENFFDWYDHGLNDSDKEFSSYGQRHWTRKKFEKKSALIAKSIIWMESREGTLPDVICLSEIENRYVLRHLLAVTPLSRFGYEIIHYDSPDPRGIDVAMLYRKSSVKLDSSWTIRVGGFQTRDILQARFITKGGDSLAVTAVHFPSKYGGKESDDRRKAAVNVLLNSLDCQSEDGWGRQIIMGDFNEVPSDEIFSKLNGRMENLSLPLSERGEGTIRFDGRWELIDQILVSHSMERGSIMKIFNVPFLITKDKQYAGVKPLRTYVGPRYQGGVSDHFPVGVILELSEESGDPG